MIVEDEEQITRFLRSALIQFGHDVCSAVSTGEEALRIAGEARPDLVLMDIVLAGEIDGIETADRIRSFLDAPIIYLTAHATKSLLDRAQETEPYSYLLKPCRKEELKAAVHIALYKNKTQRLLKESEKKFKELAELLPQIVFETDREAGLTFVNRQGLEALGYKSDVLVQDLRYSHTVAPEHRVSLGETFDAVLAGQSRGPVEYNALRNDESSFPVAAYLNPIVKDGSTVGVRGVAVDITEQKLAQMELQEARDRLEERVAERTAELSAANKQLTAEMADRKRAQEELRASEERFRAIFEAAQDSIFTKDRSGRYTLVNPFMSNMFGLPESEILGKTSEDLFGQVAGERTNELDSRVLRGQAIEAQHTRFIQGTPRTFLTVKVPMHDADGQVVGICGISRDVTDRNPIAPPDQTGFGEFRSEEMEAVMGLANLATQSHAIVMLQGESGCGKDYLARWIHDHSHRSSGPYLSINFGALPTEIAESELFGHEAGAFTGAHRRRRGLLELAEGGTLLLNEIGELPLSLQAKLLSFLDTRSIIRLGGGQIVNINARLIAATNRDLRTEVAEGRFRPDLFYRLNVFAITIPPLRKRIEDLPILVRQILDELAEEMQIRDLPEVETTTMDALAGYQWPGNIRELRNVLQRALILSRGSAVKQAHLELEERDSAQWTYSVGFPGSESLDQIIDDVARNIIQEALRRAHGNNSEAARLLNISRHAFGRRRRALGVAE